MICKPAICSKCRSYLIRNSKGLFNSLLLKIRLKKDVFFEMLLWLKDWLKLKKELMEFLITVQKNYCTKDQFKKPRKNLKYATFVVCKINLKPKWSWFLQKKSCKKRRYKKLIICPFVEATYSRKTTELPFLGLINTDKWLYLSISD